MSIFRRKGGGDAKTEVELEGALEEEFRAVVSRDVVGRALAPPGEATPSVLGEIVERVMEASLRDLDTLIGELQVLRGWLERDSDRMTRQIAGYASLSQETMQSSRILADNLNQWRRAAPHRRDGGSPRDLD